MNRFIAEKVMGHEEVEYRGAVLVARDRKSEELYGGRWTCPVPDYTTGKDKADLMDKCVGEEWWHRFYFDTWDGGSTSDVYFAYLWRNLPSLVAEYKGWEGEK